MSRIVCWSIVALVVYALPAVDRRVLAQIPLPSDQPAAERPEPPASVPATPLTPALAAPGLAPSGSADAPSAAAWAPAALAIPVMSESEAAAQQRIEAALDAPAQLEFNEAPLNEVVDFLRDAHHLPVIIDLRALDDVGIGNSVPVTVSLSGISLRSALHLLLKELELTYVVRNEVLMITTPEVAEDKLVKRVYAVGDLAIDVPSAVIADVPLSRYDVLLDLIMTIVEPNSWDQVGGAGSAEAYEPMGVIVVAQTRETHEAIAALLTAIREVKQTQAKEELQDADWVPVPVIREAQTAGQSKILQTLESPASLEFSEAPLSEVVDYLRQTFQVPVVLDKRALDNVGLGSETPVTVCVKNVSLRSALRILLSGLNLTFVVADEVLKITTPEEAENEMVVVAYPARDFVVPPPTGSITTDSRDGLADLEDVLQNTVQPDSWDGVGGAARLVSVDRWGLLVVAQTEEHHSEIANLLRAARLARWQGAELASSDGTTVPGPGAAADGERMVLKLYPIVDGNVAELVAVIKGSVAPDTWATTQGEIYPLGQRLLIRQTPAAHREVQTLLESLTQSHGMGGFF